ncbi:MAG: hypothetical protein C0392_04940 [Syntrophus sp. (in: bacteria)]|nr:hypothetical protein [Syntrophus sp. (in: bacteria)]
MSLPDIKKVLLKNAFLSILKDYSEVAPGDLTGVLLQLTAAGFKFHDLSHEPDPEHRGILILTGEGESLKGIAFVSVLWERRDGGYTVTVHRFDKDCRTDTMEMQRVTNWN